MIKFVGMLRRKPGMSPDEFHHYWRNIHGPYVMSINEFARHVRKYVQCHAITNQATVAGAGPTSPFDGIAELWFDSADEVRKAFSEPRYLTEIRADEVKFLDLPNCITLMVEEAPMM